MAEDVQRWLADEAVNAHREGVLEPVFRWFRTHRTLSTALIVGQLGVTAAIVAATLAWNHAQNERRKQLDEGRAEQTAPATKDDVSSP
jgi:hypothetical protein